MKSYGESATKRPWDGTFNFSNGIKGKANSASDGMRHLQRHTICLPRSAVRLQGGPGFLPQRYVIHVKGWGSNAFKMFFDGVTSSEL